ncbi:MAG: glycoside hydrolase family 2 protein [Devosia sp.]
MTMRAMETKTVATLDDAHLHPRPQMRRDRWIDLNGVWGFAHDDADRGRAEGWVDDPARFSRAITVPFPPESELSGINDKGFHPVIWYRRTFAAPQGGDERLLLHFGAVDYSAEIHVNGRFVGRHEGGHSSFSFDITEALVDGPEQVLVVRAEDQPEDATQPRGKQDWKPRPHAIWYERTSGIWQGVWLEPVPAIHVADLWLLPDIATGSVTVTAELNRPAPEGSLIEVTLRRGERVLGRQSALASGAETSLGIAIAAYGHGQFRADLLWSPEAPNLIETSVRLLGPDGHETDRVESYFGLRSVAAAERRFLLNDKPCFLRSVLEQGYWPKSHLAAPSPEALKQEVELIKALGFNAVRIHQKVEDPRFLYWCDRLGLMVWGEMANAYAFTPKAVERFTREWLEVVRRDRNHPSIVAWVPLNESWGVADIALRPEQQAYASALYHLTKALDPSRPVISNDGWEHTESDIIGVHDYAVSGSHLRGRYDSPEAMERSLLGNGPQRRRLLLKPEAWADQPVMITEFGGVSYFPQDGSDWFGYGTVETAEDYLERVEGLFEALHDSPELAGYCYTQLTDTMQERNGLLTEDRVPKLPLETLRAIITRPSEAVPTEYLDVARRKALTASHQTLEE